MRRVPWLALGTLVAWLGVGLGRTLSPVLVALPGCTFKRLTGIACATCGLTRCVLALGAGHWREAFHWHPAAAGLAVALPVLSLWDLRRAWRAEPYPLLPDTRRARWSVWSLLLGIWALQVARGI